MTHDSGASVKCPVCGYDDCDGICELGVVALGPCANCGDPCEPGESLCHTCAKEEAADG